MIGSCEGALGDTLEGGFVGGNGEALLHLLELAHRGNIAGAARSQRDNEQWSWAGLRERSKFAPTSEARFNFHLQAAWTLLFERQPQLSLGDRIRR